MSQFLLGEPLQDTQRPFTVMHCFEEYRAWFLATYDLSFFSDEEIDEFFTEEQPANYPCIPYYGDLGSTYPTNYITLELIEWWNAQLGGEK